MLNCWFENDSIVFWFFSLSSGEMDDKYCCNYNKSFSKFILAYSDIKRGFNPEESYLIRFFESYS